MIFGSSGSLRLPSRTEPYTNIRDTTHEGHVRCLGLSTNDNIENVEYIHLLNSVVSNCDSLSLRDPYSLTVLESAGISTDRITLCEDIAFANKQLVALPKHTGAISDSEFKLAMFALSDFRKAASYASALDRLASALNEKGIELSIDFILFLALDNVNRRFFNQVTHAMKYPELCHTRSYVRDVQSFKLNEYSAVISSKYHAALIGFV